MKNLDQRNKIIEYSLKLNSTNLSPLRSGNISIRATEDDIEGYLITPSGRKYDTLRSRDIVFRGFNEDSESTDSDNKPSSPACSSRAGQGLRARRGAGEQVRHP